MKQKPGAGGLLKTWFPNRLNIAVALLLLPFWLVVVVGFLSMFLHAQAYSHAKHHSGSNRRD